MPDTLLSIPARTPATPCRDCGERIYFVEHPASGRRAPVSTHVDGGYDPTALIDGVGVHHNANCAGPSRYSIPAPTYGTRTGAAGAFTGPAALITLPPDVVTSNRMILKDLSLGAIERLSRESVADRYLMLDFTRTAYMDSSGLGVLVSVNKRARENGVTMLLSGLNQDLQTLFELTKLDELFSFVENVELTSVTGADASAEGRA